MAHKQRTIGWVQNPSCTDNLKKVVSLFVPESIQYKNLVSVKLPFLLKFKFLASTELYSEMQNALKKDTMPYQLLKGKGAGQGSRKDAKCSGLAQAALSAQKNVQYFDGNTMVTNNKPFMDDWSADGFLRWAISIGFLDYDSNNDTCSITESGRKFVLAQTEEEEKTILGTAYLSYPPVCRILGILSDGNLHTKFEIGKQLGFTDEAGFTSIPQNIWVQAYEQGTKEDRKELSSNVEGSSDKYARMICSWLIHIGWVSQSPKQVTETVGEQTYTATINSAFTITAEGIKNYKHASGKSKLAKVPKIVYLEMLATKASDADYLRLRRAHIIKYIGGTKKRSIQQIITHLQSKGFDVNEVIVRDEIKGLVNIGLNIQQQGDTFHLLDEVHKLHIPLQDEQPKSQSEQYIIKERVRGRLKHIDHKYLSLIDYSFQGKDNREFEIVTIDLFVNALDFYGKHLGGSRKPDGIIAHDKRGVIIDNKAYSNGFTISRHMADEMTRYVQENNDRRVERNPNQWWTNFQPEVQEFSFLFISSLFKGNINDALNGIKQATNTNGGVINIENLLYFADAIKVGSVTKDSFLDGISSNTEVIYQ